MRLRDAKIYYYKEVNILANIKSAKKRILIINKKTEVNKSRKSEIKTYIKKFETALNEGNYEKAQEYLRICEKKLYQAAAKNTIHKNAAARKVSRLAKKLNKAA
jgi:small subunit ribosomal protein S20